jgi:TolB-like protein/Flp pilus assembly protein TadD
VTESSTAVFLSYASQDAEPARRICEALRAAGIEVWFDQSELRGGDAWDRQIRNQIHCCALFVPIISAHSDDRTEGYFRLEWKLAVDRSHLMADDASFLLPVVIDDTLDATARVPDKFRTVQWSRLPAGTASSIFVGRVLRLLSPGQLPSAPTRPPVRAPASASVWSGPDVTAPRWKRPAVLLIAMVAVIGMGCFAVDKFWPSKRPTVPVSASITYSALTAQRMIFEKSIAVLPFVDMSEKKDQEYFADGMAEEILDLLAKVPQFKVIGRTSSFQFKGHNQDLRSIGMKLGVVYLVEGSVRRAGDRLRVTAQLIGAEDGSHQWSQSYDENSGDVIDIQDKIAAGIVRSLQVTVGADGLQERPTLRNAEAYDLYLRGRHEMDRFDKLGFETAAGYFQQALEIDPSLVRAAEWLGAAHEFLAEWGFVPARDGYETTRASLKRALALDPRSGLAHALMCTVNGIYDWNWPVAVEECKLAVTLEPRNPQVLGYAGQIQAVAGHWDEAERLTTASIALDPLFAGWHDVLAIIYDRSGQLSQAEAERYRTIEISPTYERAHFDLAMTLVASGKLEGALSEIRRETLDGVRDAGFAVIYDAIGHRSDADAALLRFTKKHATDRAYRIAQVHAYREETDSAFVWLDRAYDQKDVDLWWFKGNLAFKNLENDTRYKAFLHRMNLPK